jgi:Xaa-Pro aminopeptidase
MGEAQQEKVKLVQDIMALNGIPLYLVWSDHGSDPMFEDLVRGAVTPAAVILTPTQRRVIINDLDKPNISQEEWHDEMLIIVKRQQEYSAAITNTLRDLEFAKSGRVALNYCMTDGLVDKLGGGRRDWLDMIVAEAFPEVVAGRNIREVLFSGSAIPHGLYDRKTPRQIEQLELACNRANDILRTAFGQLRAGMTDYEARDLVRRITEETRPAFLAEHSLTSEDWGWDQVIPITLTGKSFEKGGHADTCGEILEPGNTVYFDFGVLHTYPDGTQAASDIQRMGYVLRPGETEPSEHAQRIFRILYDAVTAGIDALQPGVLGYDVDQIVRARIKAAGSDYDHATGHPIGKKAHNPGTVLRERQPIPGPEAMPVQPTGTYTIEPRIPIENGGSIEEDVYVNPDGPNRTLCPRQEKLYLIH